MADSENIKSLIATAVTLEPNLRPRLRHLKGRTDVAVLALPRGGVPVAHQVAHAIGYPSMCFLVRKLGLPGHRELAMGAIGSGDVRVLNDQVVGCYRVPKSAIDAVAHEEQAELERREREYRAVRTPVALKGRTAILVDDGLATGSTMKAAVKAVRAARPDKVIVAVPARSLRPPRVRGHLPTRSSAPVRRSPLPQSASGTATSRRQQTTRFAPALAGRTS